MFLLLGVARPPPILGTAVGSDNDENILDDINFKGTSEAGFESYQGCNFLDAPATVNMMGGRDDIIIRHKDKDIVQDQNSDKIRIRGDTGVGKSNNGSGTSDIIPGGLVMGLRR